MAFQIRIHIAATQIMDNGQVLSQRNNDANNNNIVTIRIHTDTKGCSPPKASFEPKNHMTSAKMIIPRITSMRREKRKSRIFCMLFAFAIYFVGFLIKFPEDITPL